MTPMWRPAYIDFFLLTSLANHLRFNMLTNSEVDSKCDNYNFTSIKINKVAAGPRITKKFMTEIYVKNNMSKKTM